MYQTLVESRETRMSGAERLRGETCILARERIETIAYRLKGGSFSETLVTPSQALL